MAASPTLRRRRLARQLLTLRAARGLTVDAVAKEAKLRSPARPWSAAKVTRIEGRKVQQLRESDLLTLLDVYGVDDPEERAAYVKLAKEASQTGWWVGYRDVLGAGTFTDLETEASDLHIVEIGFVPGLLQTADYARAVAIGSGVAAESEITRRVEARMLRRQILERSDAPRVVALIDESAIRKTPAGIRDAQIRHLLDMQRRPTIDIQVVPDTAGPHAALTGAFTIMRFPHDPPVVFLEQSRTGLFLEEPEELTHYELVIAGVAEAALSAEDSVAFLEAHLTGSQ